MYNFKIDNQNIEMADPLKPYQYEFECNYSVQDSEFLNSMNYLLGPQLAPGSQLQIITHEAFHRAQKLISQAKRSICISISSDFNNPDGEALAELLAHKAQSGTPVHLIQVGRPKLFSAKAEEKLIQADVELFTWIAKDTNPASAPAAHDFTSITINGHTSLLLSPNRQLVIELKGPICGQIQSAFNEKWIEVQEQVTHGEFYFSTDSELPDNSETNTNLTQYVDFGNTKTLHRFYLNFVYGIGIAHKTLIISQALLDNLPKELPPLTRELEKAKQRQVQIQIVPSKYAFLIADQTWLSWRVKEHSILNAHSQELAQKLAISLR